MSVIRYWCPLGVSDDCFCGSLGDCLAGISSCCPRHLMIFPLTSQMRLLSSPSLQQSILLWRLALQAEFFRENWKTHLEGSEQTSYRGPPLIHRKKKSILMFLDVFLVCQILSFSWLLAEPSSYLEFPDMSGSNFCFPEFQCSQAKQSYWFNLTASLEKTSLS